MSAIEANGFLEILLQAATRDLRRRTENFAFDQLESALGILVGKGLRFALGPVGFVLPVHKVLTWSARITVQALRDWQEAQRQAVGTAYNIHTTKSGLLVAENTNPCALRSVPLPLPDYAEFSVAKLVSPHSRRGQQSFYLKPSSLQRMDGSRVFRDLWAINRGATCPHCFRRISRYGSLELGHTFACPQNGFRQTGETRIRRRAATRPHRLGQQIAAKHVCVFCGKPLARFGGVAVGHAPNCILNPQRFGLAGTALQRSSAQSRISISAATAKNTLVCPKCKLPFNRRGDLDAHLSKWHQVGSDKIIHLSKKPASGGKLTCRKCGLPFARQGDLDQHIRSWHKLGRLQALS